MDIKKRLCDLPLGEEGRVLRLEFEGSMQRRLLDIGMTRGTGVKCIGRSPLGDPMLFSVRGTSVAIRKRDAGGIIIE